MSDFRRRRFNWMLSTAFVVVLVGRAAPVVTAQGTPAGLVEKRVVSLGRIAGLTQPEEFQRLRDVWLSPNGNSLVCLTTAEGKSRILWNGKAGPVFELYLRGTLRFSDDGRRLAYGIRRAGVHLVVCDDKEVLHARDPALSPNGKRLACAHMPPTGWKFMTVNGKPVGPKVSDGVSSPVFSPDGKHLAFRASRRLRYWFIVHDGKKLKTWASVGRPVFSPNSKRLAYAARKHELGRADEWFVVCGKTKSRPYDQVGKPVFSSDSRRLAHRASRDNKWFVVLDRKELSQWPHLRDPAFAPIGRHLAYVAKLQNRFHVVRNEKRSLSYKQVSAPVFSPDGKHLAYWGTRKDTTWLVCDKKKCAPLGEEGGTVTWLGFSPDSKHLAYAVRRASGDGIVCDGVASPEHQRVLVPKNYALVPGKLRYVAVDSPEAWLVEVDWPRDRTWQDCFKPEKN